jgi:hypothetical protein
MWPFAAATISWGVPMEDAVIDIRNAKSEEQLKELASLARLIAFARENARELNAEFPAHCLDMALNALLQDLQGSAAPAIAEEGQRLEAAFAVRH